jgi:fatty-acid desaturase
MLSLLWFGEPAHTNHHTFPSSAFHGTRRFKAALDPGGWVITRAREARTRLEGRAERRVKSQKGRTRPQTMRISR